MPWFRVDDGFTTSVPVLKIPRRYRTQAVGLWVLAGAWSAKELTDGFIPECVIEDFGGTPAIAARLVACGLWEKAEKGYQLVGWSKYQPTKQQVLTSRSEAAERKKRGREAQRKAAEQRKLEAVPHMSQCDTHGTPRGHSRDSDCPDPTRPDPYLLLTYRGRVTSVDAREEPPLRCPAHTGDPSPPPCRACGDARRAHDAWTENQAASRRETANQRRSLIDSCELCDHNGMAELADGTAYRCNHETNGAEVPF